MKKALEASQIILDRTNFDGDTAVVLGSGLGGFTDALTDSELIQYSDIPHYPRSTVEGHSGEMVIGRLMNKEIIIAKGRMHLYEGYSKETVVFPIHVLKECGIENLIITNSAGSLDKINLPAVLLCLSKILFPLSSTVSYLQIISECKLMSLDSKACSISVTFVK